jgi:hypothetical protein
VVEPMEINTSARAYWMLCRAANHQLTHMISIVENIVRSNPAATPDELTELLITTHPTEDLIARLVAAVFTDAKRRIIRELDEEGNLGQMLWCVAINDQTRYWPIPRLAINRPSITERIQ